MAKTRTQRNAERAVAGLRRAGRIGNTAQRTLPRGGFGGPLAKGGERGATPRELAAVRRGQNVGTGHERS